MRSLGKQFSPRSHSWMDPKGRGSKGQWLGRESTLTFHGHCAQTEKGRKLKIGTQMRTGILYLLLKFQENPFTPSLCVPLGNSFPRALTPGWISLLGQWLGRESTLTFHGHCAQTEKGRKLKIGTQMRTGILYLLLKFQENPFTPSLCVPLGNCGSR